MSLLAGCPSPEQEHKKEFFRPNVILIMADDMGYECLGAYGSTEYQTPRLDQLAAEGIRFDHCISQPLCTPSRVKIMTGKYNYRNYEYFGYLDTAQTTFAHLMKQAGYHTAIVGKWQLNGLAYPDDIAGWDNPERPYAMGFDEYCLWQLTRRRSEGERFANPLIEQNGKILDTDLGDYGPDIFTNYALDFIDRKADSAFFIYFPMVLVHEPFVPTPDSEAWVDSTRRYEKDTAYFADMVAYTDKIVGRFVDKLQEKGIAEKTLLLFTGDNGTHSTIYSHLPDRVVQGGKGNTTDAGVHVPFIAWWPNGIKKPQVFNDLIEFSDFFPTLAELAGIETTSDGKSFYPLLTGAEYEPRETVFVHYDPRWGKFVNQHRDQFSQTLNYKLYQDGAFYNLDNDILEEHPLPDSVLTAKEKSIRAQLQEELNQAPEWKSK